MPTLIIRHPDGSEQEWELTETLTVGRADSNDLQLTEGGVSRKHASFTVDGDDVLVDDVGSANGTFLDGERVEGPTLLGIGSVVVVGDYEVSLKSPKGKRAGARAAGKGASRSTKVVPLVAPTGPSALAKRTKPNRATTPQIRGLSGTIEGQLFPIKGILRVGRMGQVDIEIDDDSVSRKHAEIEAQGKEIVLRDLGSANGTTVNGVPISEDTVLNSGDIIQFGVIEAIFETPAPAGLAKGGSSAVASRRAGGKADAAGKGGGLSGARRKRLLIIAGSVAALLVVLAVAKKLSAPKPVDPPPVGKTATGTGKPAVAKGVDDIEDLLSVCRQYSSTEGPTGADWSRAEEACKGVLEIEPIHREALELMKKISIGRVCEEKLKQARSKVGANRSEEAIALFSEIKPECVLFTKALDAAKEPAEEVKKAAGKDCKDYATAGKWENALTRCEVYVRLACQLMPIEEQQLPPMMSLKLDGPLGRNDWRPKDPLYVNFLKARQKLKPGEPPWECPELAVFRPPKTIEDPSKKVKAAFVQRYPEPDIARALTLYFDGKFQEMLAPLQRIIDTMAKAQFHQQARDLLRDISGAQSLYGAGVTALGNQKYEEAAEKFNEALILDEGLVLGPNTLSAEEKRRELQRSPSWLRATITKEMGKASLDAGKELFDRHDVRQACRLWKIGHRFNKTDFELLKYLTRACTKRASELMKDAKSCADYKQVFEYAVDGDGIKEKATIAREDLSCQD